MSSIKIFGFFSLLFLLVEVVIAQGSYAPRAGQLGSTAMHKDSVAFTSWASQCSIERGWQNISDTSLGKASVGDSSMALGKAGNAVVSLGDGGIAILQFDGLIYDGPGADFAIFENSFLDDFLELALVEVSSDGENFYRFPAYSESDTSQQIGGFGRLDASNIHNLAGKYRMNYGTPFDLADLKNIAGLNIDQISHIKLIDVVGSLDSAYCSRDALGRKINDPFPTPFPSAGFDLDAVGVVHLTAVGIKEQKQNKVEIYPNPFSDQLNLKLENSGRQRLRIFGMDGKLLYQSDFSGEVHLDLAFLSKGNYFLELIDHKGERYHQKLIKW